MTDSEIRALIEKARAATPGPWYATWDDWREDPERADTTVWTVGPKADQENWRTDSANAAYGISRQDAEFIAAANPVVVIALGEELLRLRDLVWRIND